MAPTFRCAGLRRRSVRRGGTRGAKVAPPARRARDGGPARRGKTATERRTRRPGAPAALIVPDRVDVLGLGPGSVAEIATVLQRPMPYLRRAGHGNTPTLGTTQRYGTTT